ncbi:hypothetical protein DAEQUDRAFT_732365 [Daedalea quercina L-15889]|uniref:C3H1-type domain-containing protein n=1 Tax=Daedalea quercina L-15889 TaxID=1314783 RepID=A0A165LNM5_9APHY|nr:hypothetical protein DAEQUDRAFT_732365 [Daedalea quercina L-15889]
MPAADTRKDTEAAQEPSREVEREKDRERDKGGKTKSSAKTKDLSHVPCKFFKVGSCTAGSSCPFSHAVLEPGQQKEVCAWFVKGNCKFGHKCALAHILPGQSMSMDRKNKKAAQLAAQAGGGNGGRDGGRRGQKSGGHGNGAGGAQSRNGLLSGSTAPTRALAGNSRSGIPMPLKATLSPSTPAPPVKDTDFASFGLPDESNKLPSAPAQGKPSAAPALDASTVLPPNAAETAPDQIESSASMDSNELGPLPTSTPTPPRRVGNPHGSPSVDFGPIGSPPRSTESAVRPARLNGFSPGTSPNTAGLSTSPFSAPGSRTAFGIQGNEDASGGFAGRSGLSASLGATLTWSNDRPSRRLEGTVVGEVVVEDEDLEEFLPSSLTDLLTPEERSRRLSRTSGVRPNMLGADRDGAIGGHRPTLEGQHHRYSRSVPAPSLLQDIKSIWADNGGGVGTPELAGTPGTSVTGAGLGNGTPSSFTSNSGLASRSGEDMLPPSNASAAFLPSLHHHYLNSKVQRSNLLGSGLSALHASNANGLSHSNLTSTHVPELASGTLSPPRTSVLGTRPPMGSPSSDVFYGQPRHSSTSGNDGVLQAHAPGQSLPQGLAAGYSRIHALPPPVIASPSTPGTFAQAGGFSPGTKAFGHAQSPPGDWHSTSPGAVNAFDSFVHLTAQAPTMASNNSLGGLETVFSRLSYSAAATRGTQSVGNGVRSASTRSYNPQGSLSPLSGPVLTGDDDDLFSMDG